MINIKPIHPFPARMAPEIALNAISYLPNNSVVLDPMVGSGTTLRMASEFGHRGIGFDMDPLAVLMARVWTTPIDVKRLRNVAKELMAQIRRVTDSYSLPDWIENDPETKNFINFWFAERQTRDLSFLSKRIYKFEDPIGDALRVSLSRLIITKNRGASLARDVSHSRPHRVRDNNNFNVIEEFWKSVDFLIKRLEKQTHSGKTNIEIGDARNLRNVASSSVDAVITSPPYLNAVDYLRGHKLSLVWLGYKISEIRTIRSNSIGAEKSYDSDANLNLAEQLTNNMGNLQTLNSRQIKMINRYVLDLYQMIKEIYRTLKHKSKAVLVIGNSCLSGVFIENTQAIKNVTKLLGLELIDERERDLPADRRYLPPPTKLTASSFEKRMRTECVMTFAKS